MSIPGSLVGAIGPSGRVQEGGRDYGALILQCRDKLLATQDTVCLERARLVTEAYQEHAQDPPPLRRAKTFAHILRHMTLDDEKPWVDKADKPWDKVPGLKGRSPTG